jgi:uncharacterized membrane protein HdeD (DUF308 family)/predicted esterase
VNPASWRWRGRLPRWARAGLGAVCVIAGLVLAVRPFTSLSVLIVLVAVAAVVTGATRWVAARRTVGWLDDVAAAGWVALGLAVVLWPDLSVRGVAVLAGVGMLAGGVADVVGGLRGTVDERAAAVLKGAASVIFGVLALAWPDVTLLVVAVLFGARTVLFGLSELAAATRGSAAPEQPARRRPGVARRWVNVAGAASALVAAVVVAGVSAKLHEGTPTVDAFYTAPDDVPAEPGALLRAEPFTRRIPDGADAWRILYTTTRADGIPALASALVIAPAERDPEPLPVIAWAHGTTGVARGCAPSLLAEPLESGAFFALDRVLAQGWVLVATDYVGLGTEGPHPYLVGHAAGRSVLDAVRAAHDLDGVRLANRTVVWGHSQGGGAALWTGQIAPNYAPDVDVLAVAALAPAADLPNLADTLTVIRGGSIFAAYVLTGFAGAYDDVRFDDYVRPTARTVVQRLAARCLAEPAILVSALASITTDMSVFRADLRTGALGDRLPENVPGGPFRMPVLIGQGSDDQLIAADVQARYARRLCDAGATVDYRSYDGRDHVEVVAADSPLLPELVTWTQRVLDGDPVPSTCG